MPAYPSDHRLVESPEVVLYLSGPMTAFKDDPKNPWNHLAFREAAAALRAYGFTVVNPADLFDGDTSRPRQDYMRRHVATLLNVNAVIVLQGWDESEGALFEVEVARQIGIPVSEYGEFIDHLQATAAKRADLKSQKAQEDLEDLAFQPPASIPVS